MKESAVLRLRKYLVYIAFAAVFCFFSLALSGRGFMRMANILNITRQTAMISIMAVGMTFVIATGQIDLSVGSVTALVSLASALAINATGSILAGLLTGLLLGLAVGAVNGLIVNRFRIPSFLVTLGMMGIIKGFAMWITDTAAVPILNRSFTFMFGTGDIGGIPVLLPWTVLFMVGGHYIFRRTPFGKQVLATGGNETAAAYSGVSTRRIKSMVFLYSGLTAGFAGILYAGRMQAGRYTFGDGDELSVIAAVIIGGTSMSGGSGSVIGAITGSLLMGVINNGLIISGLNVAQQMIIRGIIIIFAVALGSRGERG